MSNQQKFRGKNKVPYLKPKGSTVAPLDKMGRYKKASNIILQYLQQGVREGE
jgi:hypothetical protein